MPGQRARYASAIPSATSATGHQNFLRTGRKTCQAGSRNHAENARQRRWEEKMPQVWHAQDSRVLPPGSQQTGWPLAHLPRVQPGILCRAREVPGYRKEDPREGLASTIAHRAAWPPPISPTQERRGVRLAAARTPLAGASVAEQVSASPPAPPYPGPHRLPARVRGQQRSAIGRSLLGPPPLVAEGSISRHAPGTGSRRRAGGDSRQQRGQTKSGTYKHDRGVAGMWVICAPRVHAYTPAESITPRDSVRLAASQSRRASMLRFTAKDGHCVACVEGVAPSSYEGREEQKNKRDKIR
jgi:hypothetical protein